MPDKIEVFIAFDQEDIAQLRELENNLRTLEREGLITVWHERKMFGGMDREKEINKHFNTASIILLLISADFMASDACFSLAEQAVEKNKQQQTYVIPILLHEMDWEYSIIGKLVPLPSDGKPISSWTRRDAAYRDVVRGIREIITQLNTHLESKASSASASPASPSVQASIVSSSSQGPGNEAFDVFLCHNSKDKPEVKEIAGQLQAQGLNPWLDEWQLPPGQLWLPLLEQQIGTIKSAAVFVGANGRGPWQDMEIYALLQQFVKRKCPVIPVLLKDAPKDKEPDLPIFLQGMTWVDFRRQDLDPMKRLIWGITGKRPGNAQTASNSKSSSVKLTMPESTAASEQFDVFVSYSDTDAIWAEEMAARLEDEAHLQVWLDKWILIPGESVQQAIARGLDQAKACAVCIGANTPLGWAREEIERALNRQAKEPSFRVIPVLLPNASAGNVGSFLELRTRVDFRNADPAYAFHLLVCGVKGIPPGRWPRK